MQPAGSNIWQVNDTGSPQKLTDLHSCFPEMGKAKLVSSLWGRALDERPEMGWGIERITLVLEMRMAFFSWKDLEDLGRTWKDLEVLGCWRRYWCSPCEGELLWSDQHKGRGFSLKHAGKLVWAVITEVLGDGHYEWNTWSFQHLVYMHNRHHIQGYSLYENELFEVILLFGSTRSA